MRSVLLGLGLVLAIALLARDEDVLLLRLLVEVLVVAGLGLFMGAYWRVFSGVRRTTVLEVVRIVVVAVLAVGGSFKVDL